MSRPAKYPGDAKERLKHSQKIYSIRQRKKRIAAGKTEIDQDLLMLDMIDEFRYLIIARKKYELS